MKRLVLASGSPRRRMLLKKMGFAFDVCVTDVDEHVTGHAREVVGILAERKARAAAEKAGTGVILASDTLVSADGHALGKPTDENDARRMLSLLSGREHEVFTGVCALDTETGACETQIVRTGVTFRKLTDEEISAYIATGEPMDKAGAYGIQGSAGVFVEKLDGSYENVMGFPVDTVKEMLDRFGI